MYANTLLTEDARRNLERLMVRLSQTVDARTSPGSPIHPLMKTAHAAVASNDTATMLVVSAQIRTMLDG